MEKAAVAAGHRKKDGRKPVEVELYIISGDAPTSRTRSLNCSTGLRLEAGIGHHLIFSPEYPQSWPDGIEFYRVRLSWNSEGKSTSVLLRASGNTLDANRSCLLNVYNCVRVTRATTGVVQCCTSRGLRPSQMRTAREVWDVTL